MGVREQAFFKFINQNPTIGLCVICRMSSTRLPRKAFKRICGKRAIEHLFERVNLVENAIPILCTTKNQEDDELAELANHFNFNVIRGDNHDVLSRIILAIDKFDLDIVIRITGDDILLDPQHVSYLIDYLKVHNLDYVSAKDLPGGTEAEAFTSSTLKTIEQYAEDPDYTEYLTYYVQDPSFSCGELPIDEKYRRDYNLSLDTEEDLRHLRKVLEAIYNEKKPYTLDQMLEFVDNSSNLPNVRLDENKNELEIKEKTKLNFGLV
jgi:spore coat polysaccharide biosynthesis protein SpsF (cytidylyltransferase family)